MTLIAPLRSSVLTLFPTPSGGVKLGEGNDRMAQAMKKIADLASAGVSPAQKQAATLVDLAFASDVDDRVDSAADSAEAAPAESEPPKVPIRAAEGTAHVSAGTQPNLPRARTIFDIITVKAAYDRAPQDILIGKTLLATAQSQLAEAPEGTSTKEIEERITSLTSYVQEKEALSSNIDLLVQRFDDRARSVYSVSGSILAKNAEGQYAWGVFTVSNRVTGETFYSHDGSGKVVQIDGTDRPFVTYDLT